MMNNLRNSVRLIGHLGMSPEIKETANKKKVARFNIATNESYKNEAGEKVNETQWHHLVLWGSPAKIAEKYLKKGDEVAIEGKLTGRTYTDKDGIKRHFTEVIVHDLVMLGSKNRS
jgi:single-strand DNA-binding protein